MSYKVIGKKLQKDLKPGDIIKVEFGDFDHFVNVQVDKVTEEEPVQNATWCKLECHYADGQEEVMYGYSNSVTEIIEDDRFYK